MKKITVYINTLPIHVKSGGIRTFLLELLLAFLEENNGQFEYVAICSKNNKMLFNHFEKFESFSIQIANVNNQNIFKRIFFEQTKLAGLLAKKENSILLNICNIAVFNCKIPQITIIQAQYSIAELRRSLPKQYVSVSLLHKLYYDLLLKRSVKVSNKTIAISNYMVQFLTEYSNKIVVIHEGVNTSTFNKPYSSNRFKGYKPYILSLSTLFPHKNMDKLIEAFSKFRHSGANDYKLIIAGKDPDNKQLEYLKTITKQYNVEADVILTGWVSSEEVAELYNNASVFVFLSSVEFFGLPVLEAMASGVPVIAADAMSLPEVVNEAGVLVDPYNIEEVKREIQKIATSEEWRNNLINKGRLNIENFKWSTTAKKFEHVFIEVNQNFHSVN